MFSCTFFLNQVVILPSTLIGVVSYSRDGLVSTDLCKLYLELRLQCAKSSVDRFMCVCFATYKMPLAENLFGLTARFVVLYVS